MGPKRMHASYWRCAYATKTPSKLWQSKTQLILIMIHVADQSPQILMKRKWTVV